ncbi:hypothetical protein HK100_012076 [Physocladia obscura]|uniref:Uncharacterized protein n=1 Tax=Physocladia obscura TaxID=109957 RepID=A0AAD5T1S2_9FUNG|nr:hypothetical protein HK100_012076 [Physocladia obscura]
MNGYTFAEGERGDAGGTEAVLDMADGADTADDSATTLGRGMNWKSKGFTVSAYVLDGTGTEEDADSSDANSASDSDSASASASASGSRISNGRGSGSDSDTVGSRRRLRPKTGGVPGVTSLSLREAQAQEAQEARDTAAALVGDGGATAAATRALTQLDAALAHTSLLVDVAATNKTLAAAGLPVVRLAPQNPVDALHALLSSVRDAAAKVAETKAALEQTRQEKKAVVKQVRRAQVDAAKLRKDHEGRDRESRDLQRRLAAAESALLESRKRVKLLESEIIIVRKDFNLEKLAVESSSPAKDIKTLSNVRRVKSMPFSPASVKIPPSKLIIDTLASPSENNTTTTTTTTPTADLTPTVIDEPTANIQPVLTREEKDELDRQLEAVEIARRAADIARRHAVSFSYDSSSLQTATFAAGRATVLAEAAVLSSIM